MAQGTEDYARGLGCKYLFEWLGVVICNYSGWAPSRNSDLSNSKSLPRHDVLLPQMVHAAIDLDPASTGLVLSSKTEFHRNY